MSNFEERLRGALRDRAEGVRPRGDLDDLTRRMARSHQRRQRAFATVGVFVLLAGPLLGWVVASSAATDPDGIDVATADDDLSPTEVPVVPQGQPVAPSSGLTDTHAGPAAPTEQLDQPLGRLFVRDVGDARVRAYAVEYPPLQLEEGEAAPPPECYPSGAVVAQVSNPAAVGNVQSLLHDDLHEPVSGTVAVVGTPEGEPTWVAVVQTDPAATEVRATFADGTTDEMEPVDGVAILLAAAAEPPAVGEQAQASVDVEGPEPVDGAVVEGQRDFAQQLFRPECDPSAAEGE